MQQGQPKRTRLRSAMPAIALLLPLISACQVTGQGPLTLSAGAAAHFDEYKQITGVKDFAVTEDGRFSFHTYCPDLHNCDSNPNFLIRSCERAFAQYSDFPGKCWLFARNNQIVWQGPVRFPETY